MHDLAKAKGKTTGWEGVRNYQARNFLRTMKKGDRCLIYHSNAEPPAVAGIARVVRAAYADHTAFDPADDHFDAKSDPASPTWMMVDVQGERALTPVTLPQLRATPGLETMELLQRGSRLSITPLTADEWAIVTRLGGAR
ncbi:MAG: EVE domain-containing protein [Gemmatimonadota bacterium]